MTDVDYDLIVIGGGPGGYVAAIRGAQLGLRVAVIEREALGGICLNWGCIPTKSFLRSAEVHKIIESSEKYGIKSKLGDIDIREVVKRSRSIAKKLSSGVEYLLKKTRLKFSLEKLHSNHLNPFKLNPKITRSKK